MRGMKWHMAIWMIGFLFLLTSCSQTKKFKKNISSSEKIEIYFSSYRDHAMFSINTYKGKRFDTKIQIENAPSFLITKYVITKDSTVKYMLVSDTLNNNFKCGQYHYPSRLCTEDVLQTFQPISQSENAVFKITASLINEKKLDFALSNDDITSFLGWIKTD